MPEKVDYDEVLQMIADCEARESKMTEWEINFILSISEKISQRALSDSQLFKIMPHA